MVAMAPGTLHGEEARLQEFLAIARAERDEAERQCATSWARATSLQEQLEDAHAALVGYQMDFQALRERDARLQARIAELKVPAVSARATSSSQLPHRLSCQALVARNEELVAQLATRRAGPPGPQPLPGARSPPRPTSARARKASPAQGRGRTAAVVRSSSAGAAEAARAGPSDRGAAAAAALRAVSVPRERPLPQNQSPRPRAERPTDRLEAERRKLAGRASDLGMELAQLEAAKAQAHSLSAILDAACAGGPGSPAWCPGLPATVEALLAPLLGSLATSDAENIGESVLTVQTRLSAILAGLPQAEPPER